MIPGVLIGLIPPSNTACQGVGLVLLINNPQLNHLIGLGGVIH